jgi:nicotinamide phosphoribosyltransferase
MKMNPMLLTDFYKLGHRLQYPEGTEKIYSTFTPRGSRVEGVDEVVFFGLQGFMKEYLIEYFNDNFFNKSKDEIVADFKRTVKFTLGDNCADSTHIEELHDLGYLPIKISAVPEGTKVPLRVPMFTIENTMPKFFWVTNFLETFMSACMWKPTTSATITDLYKNICVEWGTKTADDLGYIQFQCHNFSMRGLSGFDDLLTNGMAHLTSFVGTDTIPAIVYAEKYYNANIEKELVGCSIPATEHSVQCTYGDDKKYFSDMINKVYPSGLVSIVSDGYDYWKMLTEVLVELKDDIMSREGKVVIRPDSGDPVEIICGINIDKENSKSRNFVGRTAVEKGSIEVLWELFGGTINSKGYKVLDPHIGLIYGDAITPDRAKKIFRRLEVKGFSAENIVFGVGSYSLGFHTRDTFGMALKSTYAVVNGEEKLIFKDPKTDDGTKKSQRGLVAVVKSPIGNIHYEDGLDLKTKNSMKSRDLLEVVFENGKIIKETSLAEIRERLK